MSANDLLHQALRSVEFPRYVTAVRYVFEPDSTGDASVRLWVVVSDKDAERVWASSGPERIARALRVAISEQLPDIFPYVYFRTESEQAEANQATRRRRWR